MHGTAEDYPRLTKAAEVDHAEALRFLSAHCEAYRDLQQHVIDSLTAGNFILEAAKRDIVSVTKTVKHLCRLQEINVSVINKIRGGA